MHGVEAACLAVEHELVHSDHMRHAQAVFLKSTTVSYNPCCIAMMILDTKATKKEPEPRWLRSMLIKIALSH